MKTFLASLALTAGVSAFFAFGAPPTLISTQTINPASCAASSVCLTAVTITGVAAGDFCSVSGPSATLAGVAFDCYSSATNTVQLQVINPTTAAKDQASGSFDFHILR